MNNAPMKDRLLGLYRTAVATAHPGVCLPAHLPACPDNGRIIVIGAGKANAAMAVAAEVHYATHARNGKFGGFVTTRHGFKLPTTLIEIIEAAHPVPDQNSVDGAARAIAAAKAAGANDLVLVLLSGGASALWCQPVEGVTFAAKQALTKQLLRAGAPISEMNIVRKHLSQIKGGKLAAASYPARLLTLAISDVPGDEPTSIGSGPTVADPTTLADARAVLARWGITPPPEIAAALADPANETLKPDDPRLSHSEFKIVAAPKASLEAAASQARALGYEIDFLGDSLEGEAREVGAKHAALALDARRRGRRVAILSGGEFTVTITGNGRGGPNQEYALALAIGLDGAAGICALAADTDGIDGGSGKVDDPAGAFVSQDTINRALNKNLNAATFLANNDSSGFFEAIEDLVRVGPTQTNVNDFRIILVDPIVA
jgi:glycerate 2-kinase